MDPPRFESDAIDQPARIVQADGVLQLTGAWTTACLSPIEQRLRTLRVAERSVRVDAAGIVDFDSGGAWALHRLQSLLRQQGKSVSLIGLRDVHRDLLALFEERISAYEAVSSVAVRKRRPSLEAVGRSTWEHGEIYLELLDLVGRTAVGGLGYVTRPSRLRWRVLLYAVQDAGVNAIPIVGLLSFLLGVVIAYQGGVQLRAYGANIYIVDLVSLTILRELGPMMTAIIVAGRTGSAYAAQIATMKATQELDAVNTIGIDPLDLLVFPKLFGLIVALPLLTVLADGLGLLGSIVMASEMLGVGLDQFVERVPQAISLSSFLTGIGKTPVFAVIIVLVGVFQGFRAEGSADSVGRQTTASVVQAIFLVIVADAAFSILFNWLGI